MRWYQRAVSHHDPNAWVGVASLHEDGLGVAQSDVEAMLLYRRAAEEGSASGARNVARLYEKGVGVQADLTMALCWYRKAADAGDGHAMNRLGVWLDQQHRYAEALSWFLKGADAGNPDAMYNVGRYHTNGIAGPKTAEWETASWFGRAEALGNRQAARIMQDRRQAVASMLTILDLIITMPDPPPRCYKSIPGRGQYVVPCSGDHAY
jgi:TPR repeat protein